MVIGLAADGDVSLPDLELADGPLVVVVGSEGKGMSRLVVRDLRPAREDPDVELPGVPQRRCRCVRGPLRRRPGPRFLAPRAGSCGPASGSCGPASRQLWPREPAVVAPRAVTSGPASRH